jgi:2-amino-4-hydroxy-6-hydroxymethyldihydropteridine diphosphokinase
VMVPMREIAPDLTLEGRTLDEFLETVDRGGIEVVEQGGDWWRAD